jgi:rhodanese-related sulfurtransferase
VSILVYDLARDRQRPHAVLTGDTLFIGDVGRPDLMASMGMTAEELGGLLYDSLHDKLLTLPDDTLVYPAHGAGSMCGKNLSTDRVSTIGVQRKYNYALQPMSREEFIRLVTADQPEAPEYFSYDALLNRQERATLEQSLARALAPLTLDDVLHRQAAGAQILDARDPADFAGAHLANTLNIGLGGRYASWAGTLLDQRRPIVIVAEPGREGEAALRLGRIGFDHVVGYLDSGMQALDGRPELVRRTDRTTAATLAEHLAAADPPTVVDVRTPAEWKDRRIAGSRNLPLNHLRADAARLPRERAIVVYCQTGYRSSIAASILEQEGFTRVMDLVGGFVAWEQQAGPREIGILADV